MLENLFIAMVSLVGLGAYVFIGLNVGRIVEERHGEKAGNIANAIIFIPLAVVCLVFFMDSGGDIRDFARGR